jgi:hypothetical protein
MRILGFQLGQPAQVIPRVPRTRRDWLQLVRLPNLFTAIADPLAGALFAGATLRQAPAVAAAMLASAALYAAGIVLNDLHDFKRDLKERPDRPLPSGRIRRWEALSLASILLLVGTAAVWALGRPASSVGALLVASIIAYDILLKEAPIAPGVMGLCRALNLLLGMSLVPVENSPADGAVRATVACVMGVYVLGITLFARREASQKPALWQLLPGAVLMLAAGVVLCGLRFLFPQFATGPAGLFWAAALMAFVTYRVLQALLSPAPVRIQAAVKTAIIGIVILDAALVGFAVGPAASCAVALLALPALYLGRWIYST